MSADAWALLIVSAVVIWGGLAGSIVWLGRYRETAPLPGEEDEES